MYNLVCDFLFINFCAAIVSFKEQAEALPDLNPSVEILIRLLCVIPGWNEKNVQVTHSQT